MITDSVIVSFSCGKDSIVTLDLCRKHFKTVYAFFMYQVKDLEFQEKTLRYYEKKYDINILRIPHFELSEFFAFGTYRLYDDSVPIIKITDVYKYVREYFQTWWIAAGERIADSVVRRAMIKNSSSIDENRGRFYPVAEFRKPHIIQYMKLNNLKLPDEYKTLGHSMSNLSPKTCYLMKTHYPEDYQRIQEWFPFIESAVKKYEWYEKQQQ